MRKSLRVYACPMTSAQLERGADLLICRGWYGRLADSSSGFSSVRSQRSAVSLLSRADVTTGGQSSITTSAADDRRRHQ